MKGVIASMAGAFVMACSGCGGGGGDEAPKTEPPATSSVQSIDTSKFNVCNAPACSSDLVNKFHLNAPIWSSRTVYDEPILPLKDTLALWRAPTSIDSLRNRQTGMVYTQGPDYQLRDGRIVIPEGSRISILNPDFPYRNTGYNFFTADGRPLAVTAEYQPNQLAVTYRSDDILTAPAPVGSLPLTRAKLQANTPVAITFYGDSITQGSHNTGWAHIEPNQPGYPELVVAMLYASGKGAVYWRNNSVGGWKAAEGLHAIDQKVNDTVSDLVVIAFGMNDAPVNVSPQDYETTMRTMIAKIRSKAPATEILLVASSLPNPEWTAANLPVFQAYRDALSRIAQSSDGIAMVDMTAISQSLLATKNYYDITGNGLNHPADFVYVGYAQAVSAAMN